MANFLTRALGAGDAVQSVVNQGPPSASDLIGSGVSGLVTGITTGNVQDGFAAAASRIPGLSQVTGALGILGSGTKPKALHTEYATGDAAWQKPYSAGTEVVFYLLRADQGGVAGSGVGSGSERGGGGTLPAQAQSGPNGLLKGVQSVMSQIASSTAINRALSSAGLPSNALSVAGSAVGALTNLNKNANFSTATTGGSSVAANLGTQAQAIGAATASASAGGGAANLTPGIAAGESFFKSQLDNAFNAGQSFPFSVPTSELSSALSVATGGINSSALLSNSLNSGAIGFTSLASQNNPAVDFSSAVDLGGDFSASRGAELIGGASTMSGGGSAAGGAVDDEGVPTEWYFITPPQSVSWSKDSEFSEISTYGSNNPYLSYGTTKLRTLSLNDAMVEGFSDAKSIENNVVALEACMRMILNEASGYTSPFCWQVFAGPGGQGGKCYGTYIITSVNVKESMRDIQGRATRATVDIELREVPAYQISTGEDIAMEAATAVPSDAYNRAEAQAAANQDSKVNGSKTTPGGRTGANNSAGGNSGGGGGGNSQSPPAANNGPSFTNNNDITGQLDNI